MNKHKYTPRPACLIAGSTEENQVNQVAWSVATYPFANQVFSFKKSSKNQVLSVLALKNFS